MTVDRFTVTVLKEALQDAYRHRAFLWRQRRRLLKEVSGIKHPLIQWTLKEAHILFWSTVEQDRKRLQNKFNRLKNDLRKQTDCVPRREREEVTELESAQNNRDRHGRITTLDLNDDGDQHDTTTPDSVENNVDRSDTTAAEVDHRCAAFDHDEGSGDEHDISSGEGSPQCSTSPQRTTLDCNEDNRASAEEGHRCTTLYRDGDWHDATAGGDHQVSSIPLQSAVEYTNSCLISDAGISGDAHPIRDASASDDVWLDAVEHDASTSVLSTSDDDLPWFDASDSLNDFFHLDDSLCEPLWSDALDSIDVSSVSVSMCDMRTNDMRTTHRAHPPTRSAATAPVKLVLQTPPRDEAADKISARTTQTRSTSPPTERYRPAAPPTETLTTR